jgi:pimeloyl-ACP methyl ester carboxylesterase
MAASGFSQPVSHLDDRTVITYDPRVSERSKREQGAEVSYEAHGDDVHRVVEATGLGPVDVFASSGGAVAAFPWALAHPDEVGTVVAHGPRRTPPSSGSPPRTTAAPTTPSWDAT